jgi:signal transduction histidine kinase
MEVETPATPRTDKPLMRDFWSKFRKRTYIVLTAVQCAFMLAFFGILEVTGIVQLGMMQLFAIAFAAAAILNAFTITLIHILGRPFRDLVQAIVLVAGEPSAQAPPNPNTYSNNDGFKDILQTVYELAARGQTAKEEVTSTDGVVLDGLESSSTGFAIINGYGELVFANKQAPVSMGEDNKAIIELFFPEDDTLEDWLHKIRKNKLSSEKNWQRIANKLPGEKDRRVFDVLANFHKNSKAETVLTFYDQTDQYMPEEDELDFISFAAHELRGPITVIRGYLDVLADELSDVLEQDQAELMQRLTVTANRLTSYVNNILNASRYDRRHLRLHLSEEKVRSIYDLIADDMQMRASAQNRLLVADIPEDLPPVAADTNAVGEVFGNLIDNAIKYSNEGGLVHVIARPVPGFIEISIIDRGIGMPANVLPNLFHKFYRSHRSRETVAGTGIGLYICKAIISSHGGTITARSVENEGSTFSFTLPLYDTVADKLKASNNSNASLIEHGSGWIRNHSLYRG